MRRTKAEIHLHFVWGTVHRLPLITPEVEREIYRCISGEVERAQCILLALNGMPDHVHLLVRMPTKLAPAALMQRVKGISSNFVRDQLRPDELFAWQDGYGVFSISRPHVRRVTNYIMNQKTHHAEGTLWPDSEETGEEAGTRMDNAE